MASRKRYAALSAATRARSQIVAKGVGSLLTWDWTLLPLAVTTSRESAMILSSSDCISLSLIYRLMIPTAPFMRMGIWGCCWPTGKEHTGASSPQFVFLVESKVTKLTFLIFFFVERRVLPQWICNTGRSMNCSGKKKSLSLCMHYIFCLQLAVLINVPIAVEA